MSLWTDSMSSGGGDYYGLRKGWRRPENPPGGRGTRELLQSGEGRSGWQETQGFEDHWGQE